MDNFFRFLFFLDSEDANMSYLFSLLLLVPGLISILSFLVFACSPVFFSSFLCSFAGVGALLLLSSGAQHFQHRGEQHAGTHITNGPSDGG